MYQKGDIVFVNFPFSDGTKFKVRPALIVSGSKVNNGGLPRPSNNFVWTARLKSKSLQEKILQAFTF